MIKCKVVRLPSLPALFVRRSTLTDNRYKVADPLLYSITRSHAIVVYDTCTSQSGPITESKGCYAPTMSSHLWSGKSLTTDRILSPRDIATLAVFSAIRFTKVLGI